MEQHCCKLEHSAIDSFLSYFNHHDRGVPKLFIFVDASIQSYEATAYIVTDQESSLVMTKKQSSNSQEVDLTTSRPYGPVVGARLAYYLRSSLYIQDIAYSRTAR